MPKNLGFRITLRKYSLIKERNTKDKIFRFCGFRSFLRDSIHFVVVSSQK